ncbi:MAG: PCMD domain-containing protein [Bacteroidales bacterium]|nr:PCMD domain-containing protein [Bacteroidales bacterium]
MKYIKTLIAVTQLLLSATIFDAAAQNTTAEEINRQGKFDNWIVREIKESGLIGGNTKYLYNFNTGDTIRGNIPYDAPDGNVFIPTNVMADVLGIIKGSNQVFPEERGDGFCARLEVMEEAVRVIGIINVKVIAQGTIVTGELYEPIKDTKSPYSKLDYGIPFTDKPKGIKYDYKADVGHERIRASSSSPRKALGEPDFAHLIVFLQKRWEDEDGNIYAKRVGTAYKKIKEDAPEWINGDFLEIHYGDVSGEPFFDPYIELRGEGSDLENFAKNSKGKSTAIREIGWADADETPTHLVFWFSASDGKAFHGGVGNKLWLDNVEIVY